MGETLTEPTRPPRTYVSPLRRQRAAQTRERIVAAGAELLHGFPLWNWRALTVRSVAELSGVNERTVYRYFPSERELRNAVMVRLEEEAGVDLEGLRIDDLPEISVRIFRYVSSFPIQPRTPSDPTAAAAAERQREALLAAIAPLTSEWSDEDRTVAAAMFDVMWSLVAYERLVTDWGLTTQEAIRAITWAIGLIEDAVRRGVRPGGAKR